ncbi:Transcription initiation factor TFIID subunit 10 [Auxenochlorella protothecoides]|uniref:Transcription initiation factor TFIID subunit 10 n=2 Tax=Auxenochlorella protothecoides TaxID=3075 RepID=A0A087SKM8_AUXPR|nr:Transcription initiation factor TFIID subunit 10 [Auxenochlorella protothecoides]KFM26282.1 Transcription initiation factor TFIID subunit 10 [Auxenochlorella protothecoides]
MAEKPSLTGEELKNFIDSLEDAQLAVPDELTQYALRRTGHECVDTRTVRLVSLAAQRFIASLLDEAINVHKRRKLAPASQLKADGHNVRDKRAVLTTEELVEALKECGVNAKVAPYYADQPKPVSGSA